VQGRKVWGRIVLDRIEPVPENSGGGAEGESEGGRGSVEEGWMVGGGGSEG
jgi:hypothetical protein